MATKGTKKQAGKNSRKTSPKKKTGKSSAKPKNTATDNSKSIWRKAAYGLMVAGVWGVIAGIVSLAYLAHDLPNLDNLPAPGAADKAIVIKAANGSTTMEMKTLGGGQYVLKTEKAIIRMIKDGQGIEIRSADFANGDFWQSSKDESTKIIAEITDGERKELQKNFGIKV